MNIIVQELRFIGAAPGGTPVFQWHDAETVKGQSLNDYDFAASRAMTLARKGKVTRVRRSDDLMRHERVGI